MKNCVLLFGVVLVSVLQVSGQNNKVLTFDEAMRIGLENNVNLRLEKNRLVQNEADLTFSKFNLFPTIDARANAFQDKGNQFYQVDDQIVAINTSTNKIRSSVGADFTIFSGMNKMQSLKQNSKLVESQEYTVERRTEDAISTISSSYLQCLMDKALLKIADNNYKAQEQTYEQIKSYVVAGRRAPVDEFNQKAELKRLELELIRAKNRLVNDIAGLAFLLQLKDHNYNDIEDPNWDLAEILVQKNNLDEMYEIAKNSRTDLKSSIYAEYSSKYGVKVSKSGYYPTLSAFYDLSTSYTEANAREFNTQFFTDNVFHSYGLSLYVPIFRGLNSRTNVAKSKILLDNSTIQRENLELQIMTEVLSAFQNFNDVQLSYGVSEAQFEAASKAEEYEKGRYENGITNLIDYTNANRQKIEAENNFAQAKYRLLFQKIQLDYALGTLQYQGASN